MVHGLTKIIYLRLYLHPRWPKITNYLYILVKLRIIFHSTYELSVKSVFDEEFGVSLTSNAKRRCDVRRGYRSVPATKKTHGAFGGNSGLLGFS